MLEICVWSGLQDYEEVAIEAGANIFILKGLKHDNLWNWLEQLGPELIVAIVDDDLEAVNILSIILEEKGHTVHGFIDSEQALAEIPELKITAVFVDAKMPIMNGIEMVKKLREIYPKAE